MSCAEALGLLPYLYGLSALVFLLWFATHLGFRRILARWQRTSAQLMAAERALMFADLRAWEDYMQEHQPDGWKYIKDALEAQERDKLC